MSEASPEISVIVPTHNRARLLKLTLLSILGQENVDLEVILVDDGSSDETTAVVQRVGGPHVKLLRNERPKGVSAARNLGYSAARGSWIAFCDDDDLWAPNKVAAQIAAARRDHRGWAYVGEVYVTEELRLLGGAPPSSPEEVVKSLTSANLVPGGCSSVVVHRELLPAEPFDPSYRHFADWDLWIRLARQGYPSYVRQPLLAYRVHGENASLDTEGMVAELDVIETRYGGPVDRPRFFRHVGRVSLRAGRRRAALGYYTEAARRSRSYRRQGYPTDVAEIVHGAWRQTIDRMARAIGGSAAGSRAPKRRFGYRSEWVEAARPWLQELARKSVPGSGSAT
jgi:glycosyltransferase involved in cell wall biosynthesis